MRAIAQMLATGLHPDAQLFLHPSRAFRKIATGNGEMVKYQHGLSNVYRSDNLHVAVMMAMSMKCPACNCTRLLPASPSGDDIDRMHNAGDIAKDRQQDVDPEMLAQTFLQENAQGGQKDSNDNTDKVHVMRTPVLVI
jgi:hypothetical protein